VTEQSARGVTTIPARARRNWSWAALAWAIVIEVMSFPTAGMAVFLAPVGMILSALAWRRTAHDGVFWIGFTLNALALLGLLGVLIGLLTGDVGIGFE
jgi:hypothetical protein